MIFVYGTEKERLEALKLPAISHYLVLRGEHKPAVIPDEQMERFINRLKKQTTFVSLYEIRDNTTGTVTRF